VEIVLAEEEDVPGPEVGRQERAAERLEDVHGVLGKRALDVVPVDVHPTVGLPKPLVAVGVGTDHERPHLDRDVAQRRPQGVDVVGSPTHGS
jgi:hypothetical protein